MYAQIDELEHELYRMRRSLIPHGLHVFGQGFTKNEAAAFMKFVLRYDRGDSPSLQRLIAQARGLDYDVLLAVNLAAELAGLDQTAAAFVAE